ncbi:hypothetical protein ACMFMG_006386 [Clarireedia jacksonii]
MICIQLTGAEYPEHMAASLQAEKKSAILLLGGTGKVSRRIVPLLSTTDYTVLLASRSGSVPHDILLMPNIIGIHFDWLDPTTYSNPFRSGYPISAILFIAPPVLDALPLAKSFLTLALTNHVPRIVFLSGSVLHAGDGPVSSQIVAHIKSMWVKYTVVRATWFMENFSEMHHVYTIREGNRIVSATGKGKIPWVSVEDVARVIVRALRGDGLEKRELLVLGEELWGFDDIAELLTLKLGRRIEYMEVEEEDIVRDMVAAGMEEEFANMLAELDGVVRRGEEERLGGHLQEVIGQKGKCFRMYVEECVKSGVWVDDG